MESINNIPNCASCKNVKRGVSMFSGCPLYELKHSFPNKKFLLFEKGEHLFKINDPVEGFFCIYSGKVKVYRMENNSEKTLYRVRAGEAVLFTNMGLRWGYTNSAIAEEKTRACFIPRSDFDDAMKLLIQEEKEEVK